MRKVRLTVVAAATLLWAGRALATPTPQQLCDSARITAWKVYQACVDTVVAKDAKLGFGAFDEFAAFAKCRHAYFKKWTGLQAAKYATSTCIGSRLTDNGTTVTDNLTGLVWEKKTNDASVHDVGNFYDWGSIDETGQAFTTFLTAGLNTPGFAGSSGWRLPTLAELQTSLKDFTCTGAGNGPKCTCGTPPCIETTFGPTQSGFYWSATSYVPNPSVTWDVTFGNGLVNCDLKASGFYVRAVRGGL